MPRRPGIPGRERLVARGRLLAAAAGLVGAVGIAIIVHHPSQQAKAAPKGQVIILGKPGAVSPSATLVRRGRR